MGTVRAQPTAVPQLRRVLTLWDLIYYGMITVSLVAPITIYGLTLSLSHGHAIAALMNAMVATVLTAISYGRMAALYPSAGSAYTYVARGLNPTLGLFAGWAMLLDYVAMPLFCVVFASLSAQRLFPQVPYVALAVIFAGGMTVLNLFGITSVARANRLILAAVTVVFGAFLVLAVRYVLLHSGWTGILSLVPLYDPRTFSMKALAAGTSFAALNYLGFDSVTTLAEEVENPRRNVLLATVTLCVFIGVFSSLVIYVSQLVWPDYQSLPNIETGFMDVTRRVGGEWLFAGMTILLVLSVAGSGVTALAGAARLLFGFGRDHILPPKFFAYLDPKHSNPTPET